LLVDNRYPYVVMPDGSLRLGRWGVGHIDLAEGGPVLSAGEVKLVGGEVRWITKRSGHYQPSGPTTRDVALRAFAEVLNSAPIPPWRYKEVEFD
jgi:filamentous hemagglutinin